MIKRIISAAMAVVMLVSGACTFTVSALNEEYISSADDTEDPAAALTADSSVKTVRVGYYTGDPAFQDGYGYRYRKSGYAYEYYQELAVMTGWKYDYIYGTKDEVLGKLVSGEADIAAGVYKTDKNADKLLFSSLDMGMEDDEVFFAVNPSRSDIMDELNDAMRQLSSSAPNFPIELRQKYYAQTASQKLTEDEIKWLQNKKVLKVGYVRYNLPLSDQDQNGAPTGLASDLVNIFSSVLKVDFEPVCYESTPDMENGLASGEIDAAFPVYSDLWLSEQKGFMQTDPFVNDRVMLVYQGHYTDDIMERVALSSKGAGQRNYMALYYPDSQIVFYDSRDEVFKAIKQGKERCVVGCASILHHYISGHSEYQDMNIAYLDTSEYFSISVRQDSSILASILNKIIRQTDPADFTSAMMKYSSVETEYTFTDFIRKYSLLFIAILGAFFAALLFIFMSYRKKTRLFNEEQEKSRAALEEALDTARIASEAKTTFLSSMSHDIRTPMNAIVGMTAIAMKHVDDSEKLKDCLDKINLSGHYLMTLINDILDISKIESGKLSLNPVVFSIRDTVTALVNIVQPQIKAKNLEFNVHIHKMEYETLYADEVRLNQVFVNILTNAVKYTPDGGSVTMSLAEDIIDDGKTAKLTYMVKDTGIGMSQEFMKNMYSTFSRARDSRINNIQGTGLGLAIVKQIVDIMGGRIECISEEMKGTLFTVTLEVPVREDKDERSNLPELRILIVDDDDMFLESSSEMLTDMGAFAVTASGGKEAVNVLRTASENDEHFDIIIVDWKMPEMNGTETIKIIREITGTAVPIILVSAYDWSDIEDEAKESGASGFICKPMFRSYIYEKLHELLFPEQEDDDKESPRKNDMSGKHILVAEDNELNWEVISDLLDLYGITADWAQDGEKCVQMLIAAPPGTYDMILMDVQMPVMNGREAAQLIRNDERDYVRDVPIIAATADAFSEDISQCLEAGMYGHVSKPIDMDTLCQEMRRILNSMKYRHRI